MKFYTEFYVHLSHRCWGREEKVMNTCPNPCERSLPSELFQRHSSRFTPRPRWRLISRLLLFHAFYRHLSSDITRGFALDIQTQAIWEEFKSSAVWCQSFILIFQLNPTRVEIEPQLSCKWSCVMARQTFWDFGNVALTSKTETALNDLTRGKFNLFSEKISFYFFAFTSYITLKS